MLQIVCGRAKSGRSEYCIQKMKLLAEHGRPSVMIVPEQFSYAAERRAVKALGGIGLNNCNVMTFARLAHKVLDKSVEKEYIKPSGKQMLLYKAVQEAKADAAVFEKSLSKPGFLDVLSNTVSEIKRYAPECGILSEKAQTLPEGMLKSKLLAIGRIYDLYSGMVTEQFVDSDDDLARLAQVITANGEFVDTEFFIDEFSDFLPTHYKVISALIASAKKVTVTLCTDGSNDMYSSFMPCIKSRNRLIDISDELGLQRYGDIMLGADGEKRYNSAELEFLERNFDNMYSTVYEKPTEDISIFAARDLYSETERAAAMIARLVRENGMRFRDIGVLCADIESYGHLIESVFSAYEIPHFTDAKTAVTDHPVIRLVLSIFEIYSGGFDYESVFSYLRSGFSGIPDGDIDILENYVLKNGIRGKRAWMDTEWRASRGRMLDTEVGQAEELSEADNIRRAVVVPFKEFEKELSRRKTVREISAALYRFLDSGINLVGRLDEITDFLEKGGFLSEAEQFRQIWNILMDVLDQTSITMGDDYCSMERYGEIIRAGLSKYEIGIVPSGTDQVNIMTLDRSRAYGLKVLFVIGASYGKLPSIPSAEGILSDKDRLILNEKGLELAPDTKTKTANQRFKLYKTLTMPTDKLIISWPASDSEGGSNRPAQMILDIKRMFPQIAYDDNLLSDEYTKSELAVCAGASFNHMLNAVFSGKPHHRVWDDMYGWYMAHDNWCVRLAAVERARDFHIALSLKKDMVRKLYGTDTEYSVSRLEVFSECFFKYFMKYGLSAYPREVWQIEPFDIGNMLHMLVKRFCEEVERGASSRSAADIKAAWRVADDMVQDYIISSLMANVRTRLSDSSGAQAEFMVSQIEKSLRRAADMIVRSIAQGEFVPAGYEKPFSGFEIEYGGEKINIRGIIDRVDLLETEDAAYIRIVDYKSGNKRFDLADIYNGLDMQLLIYAQAAAQLYADARLPENRRAAEVAGVLYCTLRDVLVSFDSPAAVDGDVIRTKSKMSGLLLNDVGIVSQMDRTLKSALQGTDDLAFESEFLPVKTKKDGTFTSASSVVGERDLKNVLEYVNKTAVELHRTIMDGRIEAAPIWKTDEINACTYCPYDEACHFGRERKREAKKFEGDPWEEIEKALGGDEDGGLDKGAK